MIVRADNVVAATRERRRFNPRLWLFVAVIAAPVVYLIGTTLHESATSGITDYGSYKKVDLKALLMDQRIIAGLGNIYVCEALFRAGLDPFSGAARLATWRSARNQR